MEKPFPAYDGDEQYIFVSYAHADSERVFPEIQWLHEQGFNVWYDEGIEPGSVWRDALARAIENSALFLFFVTPESVAREHCQREVSYAVDHTIPFLAVHLETTTPEGGMGLTLSSIQAILKYETNEREYRRKLIAFASQHLDRGIATAEVVRRVTGIPLWGAGVLAIAAVAVGVAIHSQWARPTTTAVGRPIDHLFVPMGDDFWIDSFDISADGRRVAFVGKASRDDPRTRYFVWDRSEFDPVEIDVEGDVPVYALLSPDGDWFGYRDLADGDFKKVRIDGGKPTRIGASGLEPGTAKDRGATWGQDTIYFANGTYDGLQQIPDQGGERRPLTSPPDGLFDESPAYDPASNSVVFIRDGDVWVLTLDTLTEKRIQERAPDGGQLVGPFLVFARDDQIWAARYDRSRAETTSKAALVEPVFYVVFSSNGDALLLREDPAAYLRTLVIVDAAGVETAVGGLEPGNYRSPAFSPDGRTIAYAKGRGREPPDLFTIDLDTERRTRITNDADRHHWLPVWSPDGKEILYTQYDIDTDRESLVVQRLGQGTARTVLADRRAARASVWLRDGRAMFVDSNRVLDLRSMALADPDARPVDVIASDFNENRLSVSPSGRWIAYVGDQSGWPEIYVRPFPPESYSQIWCLTS